jgi:hypothetical protein
MSPHQTIAVAVRLFAIWLFVSLVTGLVTFAGQFRWQAYSNKGLTMGLIAVATVVVVLALWFFPQTVARRLLSTSATASSGTAASVPADTWLAMGCAVLGLWILASCLPATIRDVMILKFSDAITDTSEVHNWLLYDLGRVVIAVWLMFGAVGFRTIFWWARYAGLSTPSREGAGSPNQS